MPSPEYLNKKSPEEVALEQKKKQAQQIGTEASLINSITKLKQATEKAQEEGVFDSMYSQMQEAQRRLDNPMEYRPPRDPLVERLRQIQELKKRGLIKQ